MESEQERIARERAEAHINSESSIINPRLLPTRPTNPTILPAKPSPTEPNKRLPTSPNSQPEPAKSSPTNPQEIIQSQISKNPELHNANTVYVNPENRIVGADIGTLSVSYGVFGNNTPPPRLEPLTHIKEPYTPKPLTHPDLATEISETIGNIFGEGAEQFTYGTIAGLVGSGNFGKNIGRGKVISSTGTIREASQFSNPILSSFHKFEHPVFWAKQIGNNRVISSAGTVRSAEDFSAENMGVFSGQFVRNEVISNLVSRTLIKPLYEPEFVDSKQLVYDVNGKVKGYTITDVTTKGKGVFTYTSGQELFKTENNLQFIKSFTTDTNQFWRSAPPSDIFDDLIKQVSTNPKLTILGTSYDLSSYSVSGGEVLFGYGVPNSGYLQIGQTFLGSGVLNLPELKNSIPVTYTGVKIGSAVPKVDVMTEWFYKGSLWNDRTISKAMHNFPAIELPSGELLTNMEKGISSAATTLTKAIPTPRVTSFIGAGVKSAVLQTLELGTQASRNVADVFAATSIFMPRQKMFENSLFKQSTQLKIGTVQKTKIEPVTISKQPSITIPKTASLTSSLTLPKTTPAITPTPEIFPSFAFTIPTPTLNLPEGELFLSPDKKRKKKLELGFDVFIRRFGKVRPVAFNLSKLEALKVGSETAKNTLARTFSVKLSGGMVEPRRDYTPNLDQFRTYTQHKGIRIEQPDTYIQKSKYSLGSVGEIKEIQLSRIKKLW